VVGGFAEDCKQEARSGWRSAEFLKKADKEGEISWRVKSARGKSTEKRKRAFRTAQSAEAQVGRTDYF